MLCFHLRLCGGPRQRVSGYEVRYVEHVGAWYAGGWQASREARGTGAPHLACCRWRWASDHVYVMCLPPCRSLLWTLYVCMGACVNTGAADDAA